MGIEALPEPATRRGQRSRERILRAATELFARHGYAGVSMRQLGEAAGLDNSSLYRHFPDKRSLAAAALDAACADVLTRMRGLADVPDEDVFERLIQRSVELSDHLAEHPAVARLLLDWILTRDHDAGALPGVTASQVTRPAVQLMHVLGDAIARARRSRSIRRLDVLEALVNFVAVVLLRPATDGSWLGSEDAKRIPEVRKRARHREVEAFLRGALAPVDEDEA